MPRQALRRALLLVATAAALKPLQRRAALSGLTSAALTQTLPARADELSFSKARNGLEYADAKVGSGSPFRTGQRVAVDYVMSTTGARYGSKIDATKDRNEPYSWVLGDGTTILGLAQCILIFRRIIGPPDSLVHCAQVLSKRSSEATACRRCSREVSDD